MASNYDKLERLVKTHRIKALDKDQVLMAVGRTIQNFEYNISCREDDILMDPDLVISQRTNQQIILEEETNLTQRFIQDLMGSLEYFKESYPHPHIIYTMEKEFSPAVKERISEFYRITEGK